MFEDILLETSPGERRKRRAALLLSAAGQAAAVTVLVLVPLLYLDAVPGVAARARLYEVPTGFAAPAPPNQRPRAGAQESRRDTPIFRAAPIVRAGQLTYGPPRPGNNDDTSGDDGPPVVGPNVCCGVPGATGLRVMPLPPRPPQPPPRIVHSRLDEGMLVHRVDPAYPRPAKELRVQGDVILRALISREGRIENLQALEGHPLLIPAALDAVAQWRFRPYYLNGVAVEVETRVTVQFRLRRED